MLAKVRNMRLRGGAYYFESTATMRRLGMASEPLGPDIADAIAKAEALNAAWDKLRRGEDGGAAPGTVAWLIGRYEHSDDYLDLRSSTKRRDYDPALRRIKARFGKYRVSTIRARHCKRWYQTLRASGKIADANNVFKVLKRLLSFAMAEELIAVNPAATVTMRAAPARETIWLWPQVCLFADTAEVMGRPSAALAAYLAYELVQRTGDVLALPRTHYTESCVYVKQSKTGNRVWIPVGEMPWLQDCIEAALARHENSIQLVVHEFTGRPYTVGNFGVLARKIITAAGLPAELQFRDLRRSGLTEGGDAGATDAELAAGSGQKTRAMVARYTRPTLDQAGELVRKRLELRTKRGQKSESVSEKSRKGAGA